MSWILTTPLAAPANTMTLICPEKAMETIIIQKPVHILKLPTACSATSSNFYLPPRYKTLTLDVNISLNMANLQMIKILGTGISAYGNTLETTEVMGSYSMPNHHTLNSSTQNLPTHAQQYLINYAF